MATLPTIEPGKGTSEYTITLVHQAIGMLLASGILPQGGRLMQLAGLALAFTSGAHYVWSRISYKKIAYAAAMAAAQEASDEVSDTTTVAPLTMTTLPPVQMGSGGTSSPKA